METQVKSRKKAFGLVRDEKTGEMYLTGFSEYYNKLQSLYKSYPEFERSQMKRFLATASKSVKANFSEVWQQSK